MMDFFDQHLRGKKTDRRFDRFPTEAELDAAAAPPGRARAIEVLREKLPEERYLRHSVAVEAIMREMADPRTDNVEHWGLAGLLHDVDIGETAKDLSRHGVVGAQLLRGMGLPEAVVHAVHAHDDRPGVARSSRIDHAVYCADQVYWLASGSGYGMESEKLHATPPAVVWEAAQSVPSKKAILGQIARECGEIGLTMERAMAAAQAASKKLAGAAAK
jgi:putative nucleotidyltransferase with HDIG domain